jgi:hypothetical protein
MSIRWISGRLGHRLPFGFYGSLGLGMLLGHGRKSSLRTTSTPAPTPADPGDIRARRLAEGLGIAAVLAMILEILLTRALLIGLGTFGFVLVVGLFMVG